MAADASGDAPDRYDEIVVVGGGCYGSYYVRQLLRGAEAGAIAWERLIVVDRDVNCRVASEFPATTLVAAEWDSFFDAWLARPVSNRRDAVVPSPLMPHLFYECLERHVRRMHPARVVKREALNAQIGAPWERHAPDGVAYVSHATWTCPTNCVEPRICPHTRHVRDWTMPATLANWVNSQNALGDPILGPFTFHCTHRAFGVGMVDKAPIQRAAQTISDAVQDSDVRALIATASHCHGAVAMLKVGASTGAQPMTLRKTDDQ